MSIDAYIARLSDRLAPRADGGGPVVVLLEMAGELPPMEATLKTEETRFHGCQSRVWLDLRHDPDTRIVRVAADSDARIMRGLLAVAVGLYDGRSAGEIAATPPDRLREAGLIDLLSPSRANGFHRLLKHVHGYAAALAGERAEP